MDENFIRNSFTQMGEVITGIKLLKNKFTGEAAGYCFVQFQDDFSALTAMHKLNNKMIPNSQPPTKYRLNHTSLGGKQAMDRDYSLWIGDLSPDVDDYTLYKGFASRYPSVRLAKGN
jgi:RNA recognition motif-containing protein